MTNPGAEARTGTSESTAATALPRGFERLLRTALVIIPIGVVGNIAFSLLVTDRALLVSVLGFPRIYLLAALVLGLIPWFTNALRLLIWTRFLSHRISFRAAFQITLATDLGAAVSPTAVGGGFFKWGLLVRRGVSPGAAASLTTLTPLEDGLFFLLALPLAVYLTASWDNPVLAAVADQFRERAIPVILIAAAIAAFTWLGVWWALGGGLGRTTQRRSKRVLNRALSGLRATWVDARQVYRLIRKDGKSRFLLSMLLTGVQWTARYSIISVLIAFLGGPVQPVLFWLLQWVVFTLAAFIPTPGAAGGAEAAFFVIYTPFVPPEVIGLATAGWRFFTFYLLLGLAALTYFALGRAAQR
jgi:glycosyltransferase 2 family protein